MKKKKERRQRSRQQEDLAWIVRDNYLNNKVKVSNLTRIDGVMNRIDNAQKSGMDHVIIMITIMYIL